MLKSEESAYQYEISEWLDKNNFIRPIHLYPNQFPSLTLSKEECAELIRHAQMRKYNIRNTLGAGSWDVHPSKSLEEVQKAKNVALKINSDTYQFDLDEDNFEAIIHKFQSGMGYCYHTDIGPYRPYCKLAVSIQLNSPDEYEGGELAFFSIGSFEEVDTLINRERGAMSVFPSFVPHKVNKIRSGSRYSLILFFFGERFR